MEVVKRKLVPIKSTVSVKNSTLSLNFMATIGIVIQTIFLMRMLNTLVERTMTKIIPLLPLKKRNYDHQRLQYLQEKGYNVEIIWESNWNTLVECHPEIKTYISKLRTFTHFKKTHPRPNLSIYYRRTFIWICRMWH